MLVTVQFNSKEEQRIMDVMPHGQPGFKLFCCGTLESIAEIYGKKCDECKNDFEPVEVSEDSDMLVMFALKSKNETLELLCTLAHQGLTKVQTSTNVLNFFKSRLSVCKKCQQKNMSERSSSPERKKAKIDPVSFNADRVKTESEEMATESNGVSETVPYQSETEEEFRSLDGSRGETASIGPIGDLVMDTMDEEEEDPMLQLEALAYGAPSFILPRPTEERRILKPQSRLGNLPVEKNDMLAYGVPSLPVPSATMPSAVSPTAPPAKVDEQILKQAIRQGTSTVEKVDQIANVATPSTLPCITSPPVPLPRVPSPTEAKPVLKPETRQGRSFVENQERHSEVKKVLNTASPVPNTEVDENADSSKNPSALVAPKAEPGHRQIKNESTVEKGKEQCLQCRKFLAVTQGPDFKTNMTYSIHSHCRTHVEILPFQCHTCDYACRYANLVKKHYKLHHPAVEPNYRDLSNDVEYLEEVTAKAKQCFPDWVPTYRRHSTGIAVKRPHD